MKYAIEPPAPTVLPVEGTDTVFPVNNVFCVGRNYADHAIEMGGDPDREPPFFFIKPAFTLLPGGMDMKYPGHSEDVHHEVELMVALKGGGTGISVEEAGDLIFGYAVAIDMTRRDLQSEAKQKGRPWEAGKTFPHAVPCGAVAAVEKTGLLDSAGIRLVVNGETRQAGDLNQMIWKVPEIIARLSELFELAPGDLLLTGTPAGVGPIARGDRIDASVAGLPPLSFRVSSD